MSSESLENLIKKDRLQVFLLECPCNIPFNFVSHHWFVVNKYGVLSRWEVLFRNSASKASIGHLNRDFYPPFQGIEILPFTSTFFWKAKLIGCIEGNAESEVSKMIDFIENSDKTYPYCHTYSLFGPNSNTYVQLVLNNFPTPQMSLSKNAIGRNFRIRPRSRSY